MLVLSTVDRKIMVTAAFWAILVGLAGGVFGAPLTFDYEGVVDVTSGGAPFSAFLNEPIRVSYTFESTTPDSDPNPQYGVYPNAVSAITVAIGANTYTSGTGDIDIHIDPGLEHHFGVASDQMAGPDVGGVAPSDFIFNFRDFNGTALNRGDQLPTSPLDPNDFSVTGIAVLFDLTVISPGGVPGFASIGTFFNLQLVPEPSAALLGAVGMLSLLNVRCRKK